MALSGVRISWLMLAWRLDFSCATSSAWRLAFSSARDCITSLVTSSQTPLKTTQPSPSMWGLARVLIQRVTPSAMRIETSKSTGVSVCALSWKCCRAVAVAWAS